MKSVHSPPNDTSKAKHTLQDRLLETFRKLPAETKFWIRFHRLLCCVGEGRWCSDSGFGKGIREVVEAQNLTDGIPPERPDAQWLAEVVMSIEAMITG